jgi:hypothetical protein
MNRREAQMQAVGALANARNPVEKVAPWGTTPVLGNMQTETTYTEHQNVGGV